MPPSIQVNRVNHAGFSRFYARFRRFWRKTGQPLILRGFQPIRLCYFIISLYNPVYLMGISVYLWGSILKKAHFILRQRKGVTRPPSPLFYTPMPPKRRRPWGCRPRAAVDRSKVGKMGIIPTNNRHETPSNAVPVPVSGYPVPLSYCPDFVRRAVLFLIVFRIRGGYSAPHFPISPLRYISPFRCPVAPVVCPHGFNVSPLWYPRCGMPCYGVR